jgi:hypothetical protein
MGDYSSTANCAQCDGLVVQGASNSTTAAIYQDSRKQRSCKEVFNASVGADASAIRRAMHAIRVAIKAGRIKLRLS